MGVMVGANERVITAGSYFDEQESATVFDEAVPTDLFNVYSEVPGYYLQPRLDQVDRTCRIDRILSPKPRLIELGWTQGPVGVELKASGLKAGPGISQMLDYSRAVFTIRGGFHILIAWVFMWPLEKQIGTVGSIMAQNRIGSADSSKWDQLRLFSGDLKILRASRDGEVEIGLATNGLKIGSRSLQRT